MKEASRSDAVIAANSQRRVAERAEKIICTRERKKGVLLAVIGGG